MLTAKRANPSSKREVTFRLFSIMFLVFSCASFFFFFSSFWGFGGGGGADERLGGWGGGEGAGCYSRTFLRYSLVNRFLARFGCLLLFVCRRIFVSVRVLSCI